MPIMADRIKTERKFIHPMRTVRLQLLILVLAVSHAAISQDSTHSNVSQIPTRYLETVSKKANNIQQNIDKKSEKVLVRMQKEEAKLLEVEKERDKVKSHRIAKLDQLRQKLDEGTTSDKIQQGKRYLKVVDEQLLQKEAKVKIQKKQVEAAQTQVEEARKDLFKKQQAVEKLIIHRKEWDKEMKAIVEHQENLESDELGSAMHLLRKRAKKTPDKEQG